MVKRTSTVFVTEKDKEDLQRYCKEISVILDKYPYSNDYSDHFVTAMCTVKNSFSKFEEWVNILSVEKK